MKLLVDMNLSPSWISRLEGHDFESVHWSSIGAAAAADDEIPAWAQGQAFVVITNDLDFSAILAAMSGVARAWYRFELQDLISDAAVNPVARALEVYREEIDEGALLSIDESGTREGCFRGNTLAIVCDHPRSITSWGH